MQVNEPKELLASILQILNLPYETEGLGALRMWGQTGDRPTIWVAAADPVYLEPRLDHLCLHSLGKSAAASDMRPLFDHLQRTLEDNSSYGFARVGSCGYLRASRPIATATIPSYLIDQQLPDDSMPTGEAAAGYRSLVSEVEMSLHDHDVNLRRENDGLLPVNSLWFWGGGLAPEQHTEPHPPLFANDPLLKGYWLSKTGVVQKWPGNIAACLESAVAGFIAATPEDDDTDLLEQCLLDLRDALKSGRLSRLRLLFRDGVTADVQRWHSMRIWRRGSKLLG